MERSLPGWALALGLTVAGAAVVGLVPRGTASFGGPFALEDPRGAIVSDVSLRGAPFVVFFGFTRCATVCPRTMARLGRLRRALGPEGEALKVLFVSVDAADTPADVERWLEVSPLPIVGLTGDHAARARMMAAYHVFVGGSGASLGHSGTLFLVGPRGEPRGTISAEDPDASAEARLRALLRATEE